jgi:hypothetical protein
MVSMEAFLHFFTTFKGYMVLFDLALACLIILFLIFGKKKVRRIGVSYIVFLPVLLVFRLVVRLSQTPEHWPFLLEVWGSVFTVVFIVYYRYAARHAIDFDLKLKRIEVPNTVYRHLLMMAAAYLILLSVLTPFVSTVGMPFLVFTFVLKALFSGVLAGACINYLLRSPFW